MAISMTDKVLGLMENTACLIRVHDKVEEISRGRINGVLIRIWDFILCAKRKY